MDQQDPSVFVKDSIQGIDRTLQGDYAFLMESTMIDYTMQRYCELMQVGGLLDSKGYGIATAIGGLFILPPIGELCRLPQMSVLLSYKILHSVLFTVPK